MDAISRFYSPTSIDKKADEIEERFFESYHLVEQAIAQLSGWDISNRITNMVEMEKGRAESIVLATVALYLIDEERARYISPALKLLMRDYHGYVISQLGVLILEKYPRLLDEVRMQLMSLLKEFVSWEEVPNVESLCLYLSRHAAGGNLYSRNIWLIENLLTIFEQHLQWMLSVPWLPASVTYTFLRLLEDHARRPSFATLQQREVNLVVYLIRERFNDCAGIGRDLLRLLINVAHIPEIEALWKDMINNPKKLSPTYTGVLQILSQRTSRRYLQSRLTPEMEKKIVYLTSNVRFGCEQRYQDWIEDKYFTTPESQSLRSDLIRFIVGVVHPTNELLCSEIIPRWAVIGWLITSCIAPIPSANAKLALFYDWLFFDPKVDNIMNIEPAILLILQSVKLYPNVAAYLLDFLCCIVQNFYPPLKTQIRQGVSHAFATIADKKVVPTLDPLFTSPLLDSELRSRMRAYFPEFCAPPPLPPTLKLPPPPQPPPILEREVRSCDSKGNSSLKITPETEIKPPPASLKQAPPPQPPPILDLEVTSCESKGKSSLKITPKTESQPPSTSLKIPPPPQLPPILELEVNSFESKDKSSLKTTPKTGSQPPSTSLKNPPTPPLPPILELEVKSCESNGKSSLKTTPKTGSQPPPTSLKNHPPPPPPPILELEVKQRNSRGATTSLKMKITGKIEIEPHAKQPKTSKKRPSSSLNETSAKTERKQEPTEKVKHPRKQPKIIIDPLPPNISELEASTDAEVKSSEPPTLVHDMPPVLIAECDLKIERQAASSRSKKGKKTVGKKDQKKPVLVDVDDIKDGKVVKGRKCAKDVKKGQSCKNVKNVKNLPTVSEDEDTDDPPPPKLILGFYKEVVSDSDGADPNEDDPSSDEPPDMIPAIKPEMRLKIETIGNSRKEMRKRCHAVEDLVKMIVSDVNACQDSISVICDELHIAFEELLGQKYLPKIVTLENLKKSTMSPIFRFYRHIADSKSDSKRTILLKFLAKLLEHDRRYGYLFFYYAATIGTNKENASYYPFLGCTADIYEELCEFYGRDAELCLMEDLQCCQANDLDIFFFLVPASMVYFSNELAHNETMLRLIVSAADFTQLQSIIGFILRKVFVLFDVDRFWDISQKTLDWTSFEQVCFWQLAYAHGVSISDTMSGLSDLVFATQPEALTHIMLLLRKEEPTIELLIPVLRRPIKPSMDIFTVTIMQIWGRDHSASLAEALSELLISRCPITCTKRKRGQGLGAKTGVAPPSAERILGHLCRSKNVVQVLVQFDKMRTALKMAEDACTDTQKELYGQLFEISNAVVVPSRRGRKKRNPRGRPPAPKKKPTPAARPRPRGRPRTKGRHSSSTEEEVLPRKRRRVPSMYSDDSD